MQKVLKRKAYTITITIILTILMSTTWIFASSSSVSNSSYTLEGITVAYDLPENDTMGKVSIYSFTDKSVDYVRALGNVYVDGQYLDTIEDVGYPSMSASAERSILSYLWSSYAIYGYHSAQGGGNTTGHLETTTYASWYN